jgi:hypothetical protein
MPYKYGPQVMHEVRLFYAEQNKKLQKRNQVLIEPLYVVQSAYMPPSKIEALKRKGAHAFFEKPMTI